jgi:hypothetical protein
MLHEVAHACSPSYSGGRQEDHVFKSSPGKDSKNLSQKQNAKPKRAGVMVQVYMCEVSGSIPSSENK